MPIRRRIERLQAPRNYPLRREARRRSTRAMARFSNSVSPHCPHWRTGSAFTITIEVSPILKGRSATRSSIAPAHTRQLTLRAGTLQTPVLIPEFGIGQIHSHHTNISIFEARRHESVEDEFGNFPLGRKLGTCGCVSMISKPKQISAGLAAN
jgi:hypothetical protein